jgi:hypothetical protein
VQGYWCDKWWRHTIHFNWNSARVAGCPTLSILKYLYSKTNQVQGQRWSPKLRTKGQDYYTPHGAGIDEHEAMLEWWLARQNWRTLRKTCFSATSSIMNLNWSDPGLNLGLCGGKPASSHLSCSRAPSLFYSTLHYGNRDLMTDDWDLNAIQGAKMNVVKGCTHLDKIKN